MEGFQETKAECALYKGGAMTQLQPKVAMQDTRLRVAESSDSLIPRRPQKP